MLTRDGYCTSEIKMRIAIPKEAFNRKISLLKGKLNIELKKKSFADDTAIIAKTQEELQDMVNRLVNTGREYGMEINIEKSQIMRVSRSNSSLQIKVNNRELK